MRFGLAVAVAVVVMVWAAPAVARDCRCSRELAVVWPQNGASKVPINARVWVGSSISLGSPQLRVVGEERGIAVSTSIIGANRGVIAVFTPHQPLAPNTTYEVVDCSDGECVIRTRFTTGAAMDHDPPPLPVEVGRDGGACGTAHWASVDVESEGLVIMQIEERPFDPAAISGIVAFAGFPGEIVVGVGECLSGWQLKSRESAEVRYGAFDVAGNFSGWTEPDSLHLGRGCGCRSDAPGGAAWSMLGLLALGLRRRRVP